MTLDELFSTHSWVEPVIFGESGQQSLYKNLGRAQQVTDLSHWKVQTKSKPSTNTTPVTTNQPGDINYDFSASIPQNDFNQSDWYLELTSGQYDKYKTGNHLQSAKLWMDRFKKLGLTDDQALALAGQIYAECKFVPKVNDYERTGKSKYKNTHGWAGAGEGLVQFTHWDTKERLIRKYNADERREGPELTTNRIRYNNNNTRHISDVSANDHALLTYLFYEDLLSKHNSDFYDLFGSFYLRKAGNFATNKNAPLIEQAYATGQHYQKSHTNNGMANAGKVNNMLKALHFTEDLRSQLSYQV